MRHRVATRVETRPSPIRSSPLLFVFQGRRGNLREAACPVGLEGFAAEQHAPFFIHFFLFFWMCRLKSNVFSVHACVRVSAIRACVGWYGGDIQMGGREGGAGEREWRETYACSTLLRLLRESLRRGWWKEAPTRTGGTLFSSKRRRRGASGKSSGAMQMFLKTLVSGCFLFFFTHACFVFAFFSQDAALDVNYFVFAFFFFFGLCLF